MMFVKSPGHVYVLHPVNNHVHTYAPHPLLIHVNDCIYSYPYAQHTCIATLPPEHSADASPHKNFHLFQESAVRLSKALAALGCLSVPKATCKALYAML